LSKRSETPRARLATLVREDPGLAERLLLVAEGPPEGASVASPEGAWAVIRPLIVGAADEVFVCVALDRRNRVIGVNCLTRGNDSFTIICPRQIFRWALKQGRSGASAIIMAHNHPSQDPQPSVQDREVTGRVEAAGRLLGIRLLDHLVCTDTQFVSMANAGLYTS